MKATERAARYEAALREIINKYNILGSMIVDRSHQGLEVNDIAIAHWEALSVAAHIAYKALPGGKRLTKKEEREFDRMYPEH